MLNRFPVRRRSERGQVLPLALAFIALFAGVTLAVLNYADRTASQKQHSETTAQSDSLAEGGALYGLADANRGDSSCTVGGSGSLTMQGGDVVGYTTRTCQAGSSTTTSTGLAASCTLCLLGTSGTDLSSHKADVTVQGTVAINTGVSLSSAALTSASIPGTPPSTPFIGMTDTSGCGGGACTPTATQIAAVSDPLQKTLPPPGCSTWSTGCSVQSQGGQTTLNPGVYASLSASGGTILTLKSGIYVITGGVSTTGNGGVVSESGGGVLIFLGCPGYPTPCTPGQVGAGMSMAGNGSFSVAPQPSGPYAGIVIYADRNNAANISAQGNGASLSGTVYAASASLSMGGNGAISISGRLIASSVDIQVSGKVGTGLSLVGTTTSVSDCWLYEDDVTGTSGATASSGHALLASACSGGSGITAFNYGSGGTSGSAPAVTTSSLAAATAGQSGYSQTLTASGGTGAITWGLTGGTLLPGGLTLNTGSGVISGPVNAGATTKTFTVAATDSKGASGTRSLTITVNVAPSVTTSSLPGATQGQTGYLATLAATGGTTPDTWSISSGALPAGLSLTASTGVISGTVGLTATSQTFTVSATDQNGVASTGQQLTITVNPTLVITSIATADHGGQPGKLEKTDTFSLTFNNALDPTTVNTTAGAQTITLVGSSGATQITVTGLTSSGGFSVPANYEKKNQTTTASGSLSLSNGNRTVTFTVTSTPSGGTLQTGGGVTFTFAPLSSIKDTNGTPAATSFVQPTAITLF
jgi:hypothetical protein